jgi:hypothetical protein
VNADGATPPVTKPVLLAQLTTLPVSPMIAAIV